ncbi:MAG: hypothetical protein K2K05_01565 [Muribaculaceae bacterium]|nr:hypothetical protein [Muribaculaceae bacterium]
MDKKKWIDYLMLVCVGILVLCLSEYVQWHGDALLYRFDFGTGEPVRTIGDVFRSQYAHYFTMNGRIWVHLLCQAFSALWGQTAFAICNAVMYIGFIILLTKLCRYSSRQPWHILICILMVLALCDTSYIPNCQIGYVWSATATTAFLLMYLHCKEKRAGAVKIIILFFLSFLAGNGNEAISIGTGAALIVDFIRHRGRLTATQLVMIAGFGIGGLMLCLAPGTLQRASGALPGLIWSAYRLITSLRMLYLLLITIGIMKVTGLIKLREYFTDNIFYFTALLTLLIFNMLIGMAELSERQMFGIELFSSILTLRALREGSLPKWLILLAAIAIGWIYTMKFDYIRTSNEDLISLRKELSHGEGLKVYVDFHKYPTYISPTEMKNKYRIYEFMAASIYDDINDYGAFYYGKWKNENPWYLDSLRVFPTVMKDVIASPDRNYAGKGADGMYLVVQDTVSPKRFFMHRDMNILGVRLKKEPYELTLDPSDMDFDGMRIMYSDFETPLTKNGEIALE